MSEETIEQRIVRLQKELEQKDIASQKNRKQRKLLTLALSCLLLSFTLCVYGPLDCLLYTSVIR